MNAFGRFAFSSLCLCGAAGVQATMTCELTQLKTSRPGPVWAEAINNAGTVVGTSAQAGFGGYHATVWKKDAPLPLQKLDNVIFSWALSINEAGVAAGYQEQLRYVPVLWTAEGVVALENPGWDAFAVALNNRGTVVGYSHLRTDSGPMETRPVLWVDRKPQFLPSGELGLSIPVGVNDQGLIVGNTYRADGVFPTLWRNGRPSFLHLEGNGTATALNDKGVVVGYAGTEGAYSAVQWSRGTKKYLPALGASSSAHGINNHGQVVGSSGDRAVLWDGSMVAYDLNACLSGADLSAGWVLTSARGINDRGHIIGAMVNLATGTQSYAFKLKTRRGPALAAVPKGTAY